PLHCILFPSLIPPPPRSTLFPYTTLFRSSVVHHRQFRWRMNLRKRVQLFALGVTRISEKRIILSDSIRIDPIPRKNRNARRHRRSEEHTSELQSPYDLVCRLLLEKKK